MIEDSDDGDDGAQQHRDLEPGEFGGGTVEQRPDGGCGAGDDDDPDRRSSRQGTEHGEDGAFGEGEVGVGAQGPEAWNSAAWGTLIHRE